MLANRQDFFAIGRRYIFAQTGLRINPAVVNAPGSDLNLLLNCAAVMGETCSAQQAMCMTEVFIESARGPALDRVVFDRLGLVRFKESAATGEVTLSRPTALSGGGTIDAGSRFQGPDGTVFALDNDAVFGATDLTLTSQGATCLNSGTVGNAPLNTLTRWVDQPFDTTITVNNPAGFAGGTDGEGDIAFKTRARGFYPTLRRGVQGAIEYAALQVAGVSVARASEITNPYNQFPEGFVQMFIADTQGNASATMIQAVRDILLDYRAFGIPVDVQGGEVVYEEVIWRLAFDTGIDTKRAAAQVRSATVRVSQFRRPGDTLYESSLIAAAQTVPGVILESGALVAPVGDVVPTASNKVIRVREQDVSFL